MRHATNHRQSSAPDEQEYQSAKFLLGTHLGSTYRLLRQIGAGASSLVFEAEHLRLGKRLAVKILRPELDLTQHTAQRFRREARAIAKLASEHIVSVVDCGELDDRTPYLVMELLDGEDLRSLLNREGALPARRAVPIAIDACRGLARVHGAGLVHRDIKPENLFITQRSNGEDLCKVLDFGVAKMDASLATVDGAIIGTVRYMAPEQLADAAAVSPTTDVYAIGAILYECLTGRPLITGATTHECMYRIMNVESTPLLELKPGLPPVLAHAINLCIRRAPSERPASAGELANLLARSLAPPSALREATEIDEQFEHRPAPPTAEPNAGRVRLYGVALFAALAAFSGGWWMRGARPAQTASVASAVQPIRTAPIAVAASSQTTPDPILASTPAASALPLPSREPRPASRSRAVQRPPEPAPAVSSAFDSFNPYGE